ncbi:AraC family transcriptional regulator [Chitinophaga sp. CF418]|uniref:helix-turn-helix domain-containing protein n=1 Tax=Chitinophaga sp. CF418 TaxID=1855287 RepID=UPI000921C62A|nr:helix-turn-helix domain-containing protein [Chitinophaga sp. CF418]SHN37055.1 AraC-type DNA-binding protein [Chitinophaga sp. CF418]
MNKDAIPALINDDMKRHGAVVISSNDTGENGIFSTAHRNEHFLFIFQKSGSSRWIVDFKEMEIEGPAVYFIGPGQLHQHVMSDTGMQVIAVEPGQLNEVYHLAFESYTAAQPVAAIPVAKAGKLYTVISLLDEELKHTADNVVRPYIKKGLIEVVAGLFAEEYAGVIAPDGKHDARSITITRQFKALLFHSYKRMKKPSDYADALNLSTPYLNEAVKMASGFTVSYWIQKMVMIEAKRLLSYTNKTVKRIAIELGYQDYAYFSRLFTKAEKISPKAYRRKYR